MQLFDDEFDEIMKTDEVEEDILVDLRICPLPADEYLNPYAKPIKCGNQVLGETDEQQPDIPGFANAANLLHGQGNWHCIACIAHADLTKPAYIYERHEYAQEEQTVEKAAEVGLDGKEGDYLVCKNVADDFTQYKYLADKVVEAPEKEIAVYACILRDENGKQQSDLIFLGTYTIDKARSLYYRRVIMRRVSEYWYFK